ncbi:hypothetical protein PIROE2DRAFT_6612 [Piromyces sp. E2]|nr:hypothetical protein PIROE2DRAFT_6612 [Piromyces sp. E2]|eukprot:OUM66265.1 hypothetical protein PIROE2DRAFT_6612 [Piromyces sp. E2]
MKTLNLFLITVIFVAIVSAGHGTCKPELLGSDFLFKNGLGDEKRVYDCIVKDGNTDTKIACAVDIPILTDDAIVFKVRRNSNDKCDKTICKSGHTKTNSYLYEDGYPGKRTSVLDLKHNIISSYHILHRYTYNNEHCNVNFDLIDYDFYDSAGGDFATFVDKVLGWIIEAKL